MSKINSKIALATVILSLGFAATGAAPALADLGGTQISPRASLDRLDPYRFDLRGYTARASGPNMHFAYGHRAYGASCDLPSTGCSDNDRMTN